MLSVLTLPVGELTTNCHIIWDEKSLDALVIDPGDSGDSINDFLLQNSLKLSMVLATHAHFDQVLGAFEVVTAWGVPFALHEDDRGILARARASARHHLHHEVDPIPTPTHYLHDDEKIMIGSEKLTILHTPGHTPGSVCLVHSDAIFTGDTLFAEGVGRTDFSYSDSKKLQNSLEKLKKIAIHSPEITIFSGHGESSPISSCLLNIPL